MLTLTLAGARVSVSQASPTIDELSGDVVMAQAALDGETLGSTEHLEAVYVTGRTVGSGGGGDPPSGRLLVHAAGAVVNQSYLREREAGPNPLNPGESLVAVTMERRWQETEYEQATIAVPYRSEELDLLVLPWDAVVRHTITTPNEGSKSIVGPADEAVWSVGPADADTESTDSRKERFLTEAVNLTAGFPVLQTTSPGRWTGHGGLVLYVWGTNVTVDPADGEAATYRSGRWRTDEIGQEFHPNGVTAQQHSQLLRIYLSNASYEWTHRSGPAYQIAERFELETDGTVRFQASRGFLESSEFTYAVEDEVFEVEGRISQLLSPRADSDTLQSVIRANDAKVDLAPSGRAQGADVVDGPTGETEPTSQLPASGEGSPPVHLLLLVGLIAAAVAGGALTFHRRKTFAGVRLGPLERAELALVDRDTEKARRLARKVLAKNDTDLDAWLIYGASLLKERAYDRAIRELEPVARRLDENTVLAFILTLAHAHVGNDDDVLRWAEVVAEAPRVRMELLRDPAMKPYLEKERFRRVLGGEDSEVAYA